MEDIRHYTTLIEELLSPFRMSSIPLSIRHDGPSTILIRLGLASIAVDTRELDANRGFEAKQGLILHRFWETYGLLR